MVWIIKINEKAQKQFTKLDRQTQQRISEYLDHLHQSPDPLLFAKPLSANLSGLWRYRVGKYRLVCRAEKEVLTIAIIEIGKRDTVYDT